MSNSIDNKIEWMRFERLGEMIGDGLHYEDPCISKEYNRLLKKLVPETEFEKKHKAKVRKLRNKQIDGLIYEKIKTDRCLCGSILKQKRSGSFKVSCTNQKCNKSFTYRKIK